eukprot:scaffold235790_cov56-Prasinocladus_malaysianus.AAC.1
MTGPSSPTGYLLTTVHVQGSHFATLCMRIKAIVLENYATYGLEPPALPQSVTSVALPAQRNEGSQWSCGTHAATIQWSIMLAGHSRLR